MRVLGDSWCFCNGGGKSERMKAAIFSGKAPAMARINGSGTGFLIHRNLLLTTHTNLPSVAAVEAAEIRLHSGQAATLFPHRFFITSSVLDLTMVGLDILDGESGPTSQQPHHLKTCPKPNLELGTTVYLLGHTEKHELVVGEGKVVISTDNLIKLATGGPPGWSLGSAGFDAQGNLAFMVCDPMKLATSPNARSSPASSSSASSSRRDSSQSTQFGIPIPAARQWLSHHWEGNLDELNKPRLPLMRMISSNPRSDHSCPSFAMRRQVFKPANDEDETNPPSNESLPTPPIRLLDINFPPRNRDLPVQTGPGPEPDGESTGSVDGVGLGRDEPCECSSEGETTMYSAETAESRNIPSPPGEGWQRVVGRSQSCVSYGSRWGPGGWRGPTAAMSRGGETVEKQRNLTRGRKVYSQGAASQRSNDYFSPTLSSIMKKRNNMEQVQNRTRPSAVVAAAHTSPRWNF